MRDAVPGTMLIKPPGINPGEATESADTRPVISMWGIAVVVLTAAVIGGASHAMSGRWASRDIPVTVRTSLISGSAALVGGLGALAAGWYPIVGVAVSTLFGVFTLSALTDLASGKMPKEAAWFGSAVGLLLIVIGPLTMFDRIGVAFAVAVTAGVPFIVWALGKGIGLGDVRLLAAGTLLTAWWAGPLAPLAGYIIATILQLVLRVAAPRRVKDRFRLSAPDEPVKYPFGPALAVGFMLVTALTLSAHFFVQG